MFAVLFKLSLLVSFLSNMGEVGYPASLLMVGDEA